jgi:hypothetical protein
MAFLARCSSMHSFVALWTEVRMIVLRFDELGEVARLFAATGSYLSYNSPVHDLITCSLLIHD